MIRKILTLLPFIMLVVSACREEGQPVVQNMQLRSVNVGTFALDLQNPEKNIGVPSDQSVSVTFSSVLDGNTLAANVQLTGPGDSPVPAEVVFRSGEKAFSLQPSSALNYLTTYKLEIGKLIRSAAGESFPGITINFTTAPGRLSVTSIFIDQVEVSSRSVVANIGLNPVVELVFSVPLAAGQDSNQFFRIEDRLGNVPCTYSYSNDRTRIQLVPQRSLVGLTRHQIWISYETKGEGGEVTPNYYKVFYTQPDTNPVFPVITDEELLTKVQQQTFRYFYDYAEPVSGMARERNGSGDLVTTGGSGFGLMALVVGIERGFITRADGLQRLEKILTFLERADRFHGAWSHWVNGVTGKVIPFGSNDNGGDLVETSFLVQGLLTVRQYLNGADSGEAALVSRINTLWQGVEWDWYRRDNQQVLYWHWSQDKGWVMNMQVRGWNECLITYVLAASSPNHSIPKSVYDNGWASNGGMRNGSSFEGITLPLGSSYGGPLFFTHYSFLGLKPSGLSDAWCSDYFVQNRNHAQINNKYCIRNPKQFIGYSADCWGLTASDNGAGYSAHSPTNDLGVITPTAALASMPYTPVESMRALKFFYYTLGNRVWGDYGFYDAFNLTNGWFATSYLAIDQGPIIVMIENHRTGLLWSLFMSAPEVQSGLIKLGFSF